MSNRLQPGSLAAAAPFSVIAARKASRSVGTMSRSTALTYIPADCASTRWLAGSKTKQVAEIASVAAAMETDLSIRDPPDVAPGLFRWGRARFLRLRKLSRASGLSITHCAGPGKPAEACLVLPCRFANC